jgi:hypothetical protein
VVRRRLLVLGVVAAIGCGSATIAQPDPTPLAAGAIARIGKTSETIRAIRVSDAEMRMRSPRQRLRSGLLLAIDGSERFRVAAIDPAGGSTLAELACERGRHRFVDYEKNCANTGDCDRRAIARIAWVDLDPDDFLRLVSGGTPIVASPRGSVRWDARRGTWRIDLVSDADRQTQTIVVDGRAGRWDVLHSSVRTRSGTLVWAIDNKRFEPVATADGARVRLPRRTRFEQPAQKLLLELRWHARAVNERMPTDTFQLPIPAELPGCR